MNHRGHKFRIYPTLEQGIVLRKTLGCCRFIYNWGLARRRDSWVNNKISMPYGKICKALTEMKAAPENGWLNEVSSVSLQQALRNLDEAFVNFFAKRKNFPTFKTRKNGGSARFLDNAFRIKKGELFLAKIETPIKIIWSKELFSQPTSCTISQNASGQWFASFLCEEKIAKFTPSSNKIGVDLGIETFATLSDGRKFKQPKSIRRARKKLARAQKAHARKKLGSKNREKARIKVARVHQTISNIRKDFLHKLSTQLVRENQAIAIEDLRVAKMMKDRKIARCISEQGWRDFRSMLEYKCEWYGRELLTVDRFFPSSKTCSACGAKSSFGLNVRNWTCACGATHDRDVNAATNILAAGHVVKDSGADGRPVKNYALNGRPRRKSKPKSRDSEALPIEG